MTTWKEHVKNTGKNMAGKPLSMVLKQASKTWKNIKKTVKASIPNKSMKRVKKVFRVKQSRKHGKKKNSRKRRKHKGGTALVDAVNSALGYSPEKNSPDDDANSDKVFSSILDEMKEIVDSNKCKEMYDIKNVVVLCSENEDLFNGINSILNMQDSKELYNNIITLAKDSKVKIGQLKKVTNIVKQESCNATESKFVPDHAEKIKTKIDTVYPNNDVQSSPSSLDNTSPDNTSPDNTSPDNTSPDNTSANDSDKPSKETPGILTTVTDGVEDIGTSAKNLASDAAETATDFFTTSDDKPAESVTSNKPDAVLTSNVKNDSV